MPMPAAPKPQCHPKVSPNAPQTSIARNPPMFTPT